MENNELTPGSFSDAPWNGDDSLLVEPAEDVKLEAEPIAGLVESYRIFQKEFRPKTDTIYYPCSAYDVSPTEAFPDSRVIYVEIDPDAVEALQGAGVEVHHSSALEFNPGDVDVLILQNPQIPPDTPCSFVMEGGFVLCNDYHQTATKTHANPEFSLCGVIKPPIEDSSQPTLEKEDLEGYLCEIESDEEFERVSADNFGIAVDYQTAKSLVATILHRDTEILAGYKEITEMAREEALASGSGDSSLLGLERNGAKFTINTILPQKREAAGGIYIFQRKTNE